MKKGLRIWYLCFICLLTGGVLLAQAPDLEWAKSAGGNSNDWV